MRSRSSAISRDLVRRVGGKTTFAAIFLVTVLMASAVAAVIPNKDNLPDPSEPITLDYWSEPEFLLVSGAERWNVRNRPAGTIAAAYGHPEDAIHDDYMATARYPSLGADATRTPIDVAPLSPNPELLRDGAWNVVRYDDDTMQVWGPVDGPNPQAWDLKLVNGATGISIPIVGGTLISDAIGPGGVPFPSRALVVTEDGWLVEVNVGSGGEVRRQYLGNAFSPAVPGALVAVARASTDNGSAAKKGYDSEPVPLVTRPESEMLMVLLDNGEFVPVRVGSGTNAVTLPPLSELHENFSVVPEFVSGPGLLMDFDYDCTRVELDRAGSASYLGDVGELLDCTDPGNSSRIAAGRLSLAILQNATPFSDGLALKTVAEAIEGGNDSAQHVLETDNVLPCSGAGRGTWTDVRPGSFDVRTVNGVTHMACIRPLDDASQAPGDEYALHTYYQPQDYSVVISSEPDGRDAVAGTNNSPIQRKFFNRLAQPGPGEPETASDVLTESYKDLASLTVALQFPCESLVPRPLGTGYPHPRIGGQQARLDQCAGQTTVFDPDPEAPGDEYAAGKPANWVSLTVAGYGTVDGERRVFVNTQPHEELLSQELEERGTTWFPFLRNAFSWTTEPSPVLATDQQAHREDDAADPRDFERFDPEGAPALFLSHIPREAKSPVKVKILSNEPVTETEPLAPVAVLQAPPTVKGLGQQTAFTPEFGVSTSSETSSTTSMGTNLGAHMGIEATVTAGGGAPGSTVRGGGGVAYDYQFMNEVENSLTHAVAVEHTEGYGGAFNDHTVVMRSSVNDVWRAEVIEDPTGLATGDLFDLSIPRSLLDRSVPLSTLAIEQPGLFAKVTGALRPSIDRILAGRQTGTVIEIGNPRSYLAGADEVEPDSILAKNGGPCLGGYGGATAPDSVTDGRLPAAVSPNNPYYGTVPDIPIGPSVLTSAAHAVSVGNDLGESAQITVSTETGESLATSYSSSFSLTAIFKFEAEVTAFASTKVEFTASGGLDAGFSNGAEVTSTLGQGTTLSTVMGNIPGATGPGSEWVEDEGYRWKMFMCKAPLGPAGLGTEVFVQGYVVDGYGGSGGVDSLGPVAPVEPVNSAVAFADPNLEPTGDMDCVDPSGRERNRFRWDQTDGTVKQYRMQVENVTAGGLTGYDLDGFEDPEAFKDGQRQECTALGAGTFTDGDLYRWRPRIEDFLGNEAIGDWEFFRPQVWPPDQTIDALAPTVHPDGSATVWVKGPEGVRSLRYDVVVHPAGDPDTIVAQENGVDSWYRTPPLPKGDYDVEVVGYNSHLAEAPIEGESPRAETAVATASFTVVTTTGPGPADGLDCLGTVFTEAELVAAGFAVQIGDEQANVLTGTAGSDALFGLGGDDTLDGLAGDDLLCGGDGADVLDGGEGNDQADGGAGNDTLSGGVGDDLLHGGVDDDTILGEDGGDEIHGGDGADFIEAGAGNDDVFGGDHDDVIDAGAGSDEVYGEGGDDTIDGGNDQDYDLLSGGPGNDVIIDERGGSPPGTPPGRGPPGGRG